MVTYGDIIKFIKSKDKDLDFVNILSIHDFIVESRITRKGKYKVTLQFDAKEILKNPECLPRTKSDYIYRLDLLLLKYKQKQTSSKKMIRRR